MAFVWFLPSMNAHRLFLNSLMCENPALHSFQERGSYPVWMYIWCLKSLLNENIALQAWHLYEFFFQHESAYAFSNPRVLSVKCWVLSVECWVLSVEYWVLSVLFMGTWQWSTVTSQRTRFWSSSSQRFWQGETNFPWWWGGHHCWR